MSDIKKTNNKKSKYWLSLEEWSQDAEFLKTAQREFLSPPPLSEEESSQLWGRRDFLKLMGAGMALMSFGCIRRPAEKIVPYAKRPDDVHLGKANFYSSSYYDGEEGFGILVKTREGRPIKIEGNKNHPVNRGGLSARSHSHLLSLYDPERLKHAQHNLFNKEKTNREFIRADYLTADQDIIRHIQAGKSAFLTGQYPSPSGQKLLKQFCRQFSCQHFNWNPVNHKDIMTTQKKCYGKALIPQFMFNRAKLIVSINCDFLGTWLYPTTFSRLYSQSRKANRDMNRLVVFESLLSLTGSNADWRVRIAPSQQLELVLSLIYSLIQKGYVKTSWPSHLAKPDFTHSTALKNHQAGWDQLIQDLWNWRGQSLIVTGGLPCQTQHSQSLHIAVQWLNHLLGNDGWTINYKNPYMVSPIKDNLHQLIQHLEKGTIDTLIIHKTNPLYTYPDKPRLEQAFKKAKLIVYTGDREDETGKLAHYILPDHHDLEKWSDWEFQQDVISIQQPTIRPLYRTRAFEDSLIAWAKQGKKTSFLNGTNSWYSYLRKSSQLSSSEWNDLLKTGVYKKSKTVDSSHRLPQRKFKTSALSEITVSYPSSNNKNYELVLYPTSGLKDGTLANVSWLQEFPDPVTKICWDNYFCVSPATARQLRLKEGQVIQVTTQNTVEGPVHIQPGQADQVVALATGYGRERAGEVANQVGVNAYPLAKLSTDGDMICSALLARISTTTKHIPLANVQGHHSMEGRQIVVETTLKHYLKNPGSAIHRHKIFSLWSDHEYPKHKWGMVIDLNSCTGCSACVIACQSENNTPTVGKELVLQGREMHWIRLDRYYKGSPEEPETVHQPIVCMHCDNAPCETVCPVAATVHSDEGTNDMIYNRCVGTRYCSNNCPYKVRRFNWFNFTKKVKPPLHKALNPEVTVRSRGVMEKCTFCIQRIRSSQAQAKLEGRALKDGDIQTACQQSCPTSAIVFGDLKDKNSQVSRLFNRPDAYALLEELNTRPAVRYQVKVRNTMETSGDKPDTTDKKHHG